MTQPAQRPSVFRTLARAFKKFRKPDARAANDAGERIESLRFSVPALRVGVLEYAPGQLETKHPELQGKTVLLYYPPEAVSDPAFLKSLEDSPVVLGGHQQSTSEFDKRIDGWLRNVVYGKDKKGTPAAMVEGTVKGAKEAAYVRQYLKSADSEDFGASALIDVYGLRVEEGTTPAGEKYNAVAEKLRASHLTLAPKVRDPENKIEIINAVVINSHGTISGNTTTIQNTEKKRMTPEEIAAIAAKAARDVVTAKNAEDEMASMKNELGELKNLVNSLVKNMAKNADAEAEAEAENYAGDKAVDDAIAKRGGVDKVKEETKNTDDDKDGEGATLENAKPSQKVISAFATAFNVEFGRKTPTFATLANLVGIKTENAVERITAVNAKFTEIETAKKTETATVKNAAGGVF